MSLPSSEPLPDDIHELPPARQRHLRRMPRAASPAEWEILLESLLNLTRPTLEFFLLALLGAAASGAALYFNEPLLLIAALALLPFNNPVFNLALYPASHKLGLALKSLISLIVPIILSMGVGMSVGWFVPESTFDKLALTTFNAPWWPNLAAVAASAFFCSLILIRQDRLPRLAGAILSYEIFLPLTLAGFGLIVGAPAFWPGALLIALLHLAVALLAATLAFIVIGFAPKTLLGWSLSLVPVVLTLLFLTAATLLAGQIVLPWESKAITPTPTEAQALVEETDQPTATLAPTETPLIPTATLQPTVTQTATPEWTATPSVTPTLEPTLVYGVIVAENGAIVREEPSTTALVVSYVNDGDLVTLIGQYLSGNTLWYQVETEYGEVGWMLGSLIQTPTPTPSPTPGE
ncbi:MAG: SH3 domain-containing protein [Anaerolineaceae bacterium]|nr:SH3 domain-containing protein [Anaerolineaceae bacterium]